MDQMDQQKLELPADLKRALNEAPDAWQFFDGLAAFDHNRYIKWVEGVTQPEERLARIERAVALLKDGQQHLDDS